MCTDGAEVTGLIQGFKAGQGVWELPSVMELPSVVGSYMQLAAVGNGKRQ